MWSNKGEKFTMSIKEELSWEMIAADQVPDADETVWLFDPTASEPVWPGYWDGQDWYFANGTPAAPTHFALFPHGPGAPAGATTQLISTIVPLRQAGLSGRWHHGRGTLCCGTLRVAREDFDTAPSQQFRTALFEQICGTMNAVNEFLGDPPDPFAKKR